MADDVAPAAELSARWALLAAAEGLSGAGAVGEALIARYGEPGRRYHGLGHIRFLLEEIERNAAHLQDVHLVAFAAWFHDAIYDPLAKDNEERSADLARRDLVDLGMSEARSETIAKLVLKTKSHHAGQASADEALFLDMDFAILGAERGIYTKYALGVREEYGAVPEAAFRSGRAAFLKSVMGQSRVFRSDLYEDACGARARSNIAWEIERLESGTPLV